MLWDIIRDFFVKYVFGGTYIVDGNYFYSGGFVGALVDIGDYNYSYDTTQSLYLPINGFSDNTELTLDYICMGDWLSTTATIITLVALFVGISCLMVSLFRWIVRLVSLRG